MTKSPRTQTPLSPTVPDVGARAHEVQTERGLLVGELTDSIAPMPTRSTVWLRTFVPYQGYRLARVSLKMLKMIRRSHTH